MFHNFSLARESILLMCHPKVPTIVFHREQKISDLFFYVRYGEVFFRICAIFIEGQKERLLVPWTENHFSSFNKAVCWVSHKCVTDCKNRLVLQKLLSKINLNLN